MDDPVRHDILKWFETRFGIPLPTFDRYHLMERRHGYVLIPKSAQVETITSFKVQNVGLPIFRKMLQHLKPTTAVKQRFGHLAIRNIVDLDRTHMLQLLREQEYQEEMAFEPGYVLLRFETKLLGCGIYTPGRLRSLIPLRQVKHQHLPDRKESTSSSDD